MELVKVNRKLIDGEKRNETLFCQFQLGLKTRNPIGFEAMFILYLCFSDDDEANIQQYNPDCSSAAAFV